MHLFKKVYLYLCIQRRGRKENKVLADMNINFCDLATLIAGIICTWYIEKCPQNSIVSLMNLVICTII